MAKSIIVLLVIAAAMAFMYDALMNIRRIEELRALNRRMDRFETAFRRSQRQEPKDDPIVTLVVKDENANDDLPKFGGF